MTRARARDSRLTSSRRWLTGIVRYSTITIVIGINELRGSHYIRNGNEIITDAIWTRRIV